MIDLVTRVRDGEGYFEWSSVVSEHEGFRLHIPVMRDAMKFDGVPAMSWDYKPIVGDDRVFDGVRLPANAKDLQQIADMLQAMLLTPKVIDLIWLQAGVRFDPVINVRGRIVANSNIHEVHEEIENKIANVGGDDGSLIACVGKYWCLVDQLARPAVLRFRDKTACNYGWCSSRASGPGVTSGVQCWQRPGFAHDIHHWDPSQTIRLMFQTARLEHPNGDEEYIDLRDVLIDPELAPLLNHTGKPLSVVRQPSVEEVAPRGVIDMPGMRITVKEGDIA